MTVRTFRGKTSGCRCRSLCNLRSLRVNPFRFWDYTALSRFTKNNCTRERKKTIAREPQVF